MGGTVVKCVKLLMMLAASIVTVPTAENGQTVTTEISETREQKMSRYRLPNNTLPRFYHIYIEPNLEVENFTWTGRIIINLEVLNETSLLTLHAYKNLVINESRTALTNSEGRRFNPINHIRDNEVEFLKLKFDRAIPVGNYSLFLKFTGEDTGDYVGFYKGLYEYQDNPQQFKTVVGTHFEATTARRAFPCWDEPGLKARFELFIKHFPNYTAVSNMPEIERTETPDGKVLTVFDTTPIMPTYLLTFVISDYRSAFNEYQNVSLHTTERDLDRVRYVMDLSSKVVKVMENYTGVSFGVPRIGSVTLPTYTASATEHWGLVTYNERVISIDPKYETKWRRDIADMLIAHELSHSWFGNRVTPLWWDDLWLNEAFAAYFQYYIMDEIYANWRGIELFVVRNNQEMAFLVDDGSSIPIRWTPITNTEIRYLFGPVTYRKGSAIVHMFRNVLGDNVLRAGIQKFMTNNSFEAAVADDLMATFQEAYDEDPNKKKPLNVNETMSSWLLQIGHPIVNVTRNYTTGETVVSQRSTVIEDSTSKWWIPLTYATKSSPNFSSTLPVSWISDKEDCAKIDGIDKDDWIVLNVQASGFYRVNYDDENWNRLAEYLNTDNYTNIHVLNRAQLIDDAFYLAQREPDRYFRNFYKLTKYLLRENDYLPWRAAHNALKSIEYSLRHTEVEKIFQRYILELMHSFVNKVGFDVHDSDDHFTKLAKTDIIDWACSHGHSGCSEFAAPIIIKHSENPAENQLHPDTRRWIFCAGIAGLNSTMLKQFAQWAYNNATDLFISNVGCTENHEIHSDILNTLLAKNLTSHPNAYEVLRNLLASTDENFFYAVDFFLTNHRALNNSACTEDSTCPVSDILHNISHATRSRPRLEKLKEILRLEAVIGNPKIDQDSMLKYAEANFASGNASATLFLTLRDKQLSADNTIAVSQTVSR